MNFLTIQEEVNYSNRRYKMERNIESIFLEEGYNPINPPLFEDYDDFIDINKRLKKESLVKLLDGYGNILVLRPDITTNLMKSLIPRWEEELKLKLFYYSTVFKNTPNFRINENKQLGVEYLGEDSFKADCEVISLALKVLSQYENSFILELGTSKYLKGLLKELDLNCEVEKELKILIHNKNKSQLEEFVATLSLSKEIEDVFNHILDFQGSFETVLKKSKGYYLNENMKISLEELKELNKHIESNKFKENIHFDLSMITDLDYYEGVIFKGYYPSIYTSILSGGRYDELTKKFGKEVPAVGFSIDLDELLKVKYREEE